MPPDKKPTRAVNNNTPEDKNISISGDVVDSAVIIGDNNTFIKKIINIFKSDSETLEHRNRRILLGHVENAWIKGVLDASLHGAALLDLGIKQDPEAVTKYPWAIKKESTDETLPAGTSMLEIFDSIGMGRSLLILGAPGSGKTTMLLELARQLIARAREDVTYPIPMVFNLASWTEKLTLADWLAQELNNLYSVPRKTAPDWVKGNKLLLLLDGLDEVRQESRIKCVEAINTFRKEHGLTSLAVCSRSQDYTDLNTKLSFEGAIKVQPLTQKQVIEFFDLFEEFGEVSKVIKKDHSLAEMLTTPLFLSIVTMACQKKEFFSYLSTNNEPLYQKTLFSMYITYMLKSPRIISSKFSRIDTLSRVSWLAFRMLEKGQTIFLPEYINAGYLENNQQKIQNKVITLVLYGAILSLGTSTSIYLALGLLFPPFTFSRIIQAILMGFLFGPLASLTTHWLLGNFESIDYEKVVSWEWQNFWRGIPFGVFAGIVVSVGIGLVLVFDCLSVIGIISILSLLSGIINGIRNKKINNNVRFDSIFPALLKELCLLIFSICLLITLFTALIFGIDLGITIGFPIGLFFGVLYGIINNGKSLIKHYGIRLTLKINNLLPWRLVPFLDHCVDLIFLRRVGGGYIFVHRLLMEHFAEMYVETPPPPPRAGRSL